MTLFKKIILVTIHHNCDNNNNIFFSEPFFITMFQQPPPGGNRRWNSARQEGVFLWKLFAAGKCKPNALSAKIIGIVQDKYPNVFGAFDPSTFRNAYKRIAAEFVQENALRGACGKYKDHVFVEEKVFLLTFLHAFHKALTTALSMAKFSISMIWIFLLMSIQLYLHMSSTSGLTTCHAFCQELHQKCSRLWMEGYQ